MILTLPTLAAPCRRNPTRRLFLLPAILCNAIPFHFFVESRTGHSKQLCSHFFIALCLMYCGNNQLPFFFLNFLAKTNRFQIAGALFHEACCRVFAMGEKLGRQMLQKNMLRVPGFEDGLLQNVYQFPKARVPRSCLKRSRTIRRDTGSPTEQQGPGGA